MNETAFREWVVLEVMGHRRLFGLVQEVQIAGEGFLRIDVYPGEAEKPSLTQFYRPSSVYAMTPTTEQVARAAAVANTQEPVSRYDIPALRAAPGRLAPEDDGYDPRDDADDVPV